MLNNYFNKKAITVLLFTTLGLIISPSVFAQKGVLNAQTSPQGATVYINDQPKGITPLFLELIPDKYDIKIDLENYESYEGTIEIGPNKITRKKISLHQTEAKKPTVQINENIKIYKKTETLEPGTVFISTVPNNLTAFIDGYKISKKTPVAFDILPGIYELILRSDTNEILYKKSIFVKSAQTTTLDLLVQRTRTIDYSDPWK